MDQDASPHPELDDRYLGMLVGLVRVEGSHDGLGTGSQDPLQNPAEDAALSHLRSTRSHSLAGMSEDHGLANQWIRTHRRGWLAQERLPDHAVASLDLLRFGRNLQAIDVHPYR